MGNHKARCIVRASETVVTPVVNNDNSVHDHSISITTTTTTTDNSSHDHSVHNDNRVTHVHNHMVPFGEEDFDFLFRQAFRKRMLKCIAEPIEGIEHLVAMMHFSEDRPEMQNVCIPNVSRPHALCWSRGENGSGDGWKLRDRMEVMSRLGAACASMMFSFTSGEDQEDVFKALGARAAKIYEEFERKHDEDDPEQLLRVQQQAERAVMNNQDRVCVRQRAKSGLKHQF